MYYLLFYDYVHDMAVRREPVRPAHLEHVRAAHQSGLLRMAGAYSDTLDGAAFVFHAGAASDVQAFVDADPYERAGLVTAWRIRPWNVVIGGDS
jgi:uncharacterized protein YciI